jgi:uncharacterized protein YcfL
MKLLAIIPFILVGCSSTPQHYSYQEQNTALVVDREINVLTRNEVINGVKECEGSGLRPVMVTARRRINGFLSTAPVDVTCAPRYDK